jgi:hypothetical protein
MTALPLSMSVLALVDLVVFCSVPQPRATSRRWAGPERAEPSGGGRAHGEGTTGGGEKEDERERMRTEGR